MSDVRGEDESTPLLDLLHHAQRDAAALHLMEIAALVEAAIDALAARAEPEKPV